MNGMKNNLIALDSNIFIYHFEANPAYTSSTNHVFTKLINGSCHGITSVISLIETLSFPSSQEVLEAIEEGFRTLPNFTICDINQEIGIEASRIRRTYGFRLPDSIQLATCLYKKANIFITNDVKLLKFKEIEVVLLKNFVRKKL